MEKELVSNAWAMSGFLVSYTAGLLTLNNGMITFQTAKGEQFSTPLASIKNVKWPKMQMGYGVHFDVDGKTQKLTFIKPNGQDSFDPGMITGVGRIANGISAIKTMTHLKDYKVVANEWRAIIGG